MYVGCVCTGSGNLARSPVKARICGTRMIILLTLGFHVAQEVPGIALIDTLRYNKSISSYDNVPPAAADDKDGKLGVGFL
jgi:hypothetical protein